MQNLLHSVGGYLTPRLTANDFVKSGLLTPEEVQQFERAGNYLTFKCPTWEWAKGKEDRKSTYLPDEKQFLITKNMPCKRRIVDFERELNEGAEEREDGWVEEFMKTGKMNRTEGQPELPPTAGAIAHNLLCRANVLTSEPLAIKDEEIITELPINQQFQTQNITTAAAIPVDPDMEGFDTLEEEDDPASNVRPVRANGGGMRTYDVSITYDKYYQTPRVWLCGYDENGTPLTPKATFEDISSSHALKTVTIEDHPHLNISLASIHPCKHAHVMKMLLSEVTKEKQIKVEQYLVLFLKFIGTVIPTIEYDFTMNIE